MPDYRKLRNEFKNFIVLNDRKIKEDPTSLDIENWHDRNFKFPFNEFQKDYNTFVDMDRSYEKRI